MAVEVAVVGSAGPRLVDSLWEHRLPMVRAVGPGVVAAVVFAPACWKEMPGLAARWEAVPSPAADWEAAPSPRAR